MRDEILELMQEKLPTITSRCTAEETPDIEGADKDIIQTIDLLQKVNRELEVKDQEIAQLRDKFHQVSSSNATLLSRIPANDIIEPTTQAPQLSESDIAAALFK
jgi:hypothetical protein